MEDWQLAVRRGEFHAIPERFELDLVPKLGQMINGYDECAGPGTLGEQANRAREKAVRRGGKWEGSPRELWLCLFFEARRMRFSPVFDETEERIEAKLLCSLYLALREGLITASDAERDEILDMMARETQRSSRFCR